MKRKEREQQLTLVDIYPVITPELCQGRLAVDVLEAVLKGGAKIVQLRDKQEPERFIIGFRRLTAAYGALLIINDSIDLALKYQADGVHLGQSDVPVKAARQLAPELLIGVSTHNLAEALEAEQAGASYINIGPIFSTQTKNMKPIGLESIKTISSQIKIPFTVMGGINLSNLDQVLESGARKIAMISALTMAPDVEAATRFFISKIRQQA